MPEDRICPICAQMAPWERGRQKQEQDYAKQAADNPTIRLPWDGRRTLLRFVSPEEAARLKSATRSA